jgi:hypothetical protein
MDGKRFQINNSKLRPLQYMSGGHNGPCPYQHIVSECIFQYKKRWTGVLKFSVTLPIAKYIFPSSAPSDWAFRHETGGTRIVEARMSMNILFMTASLIYNTFIL